MLGAFKRLFKVAEAETHSAIDKLEDPVKQTEQGIRDLKKDLAASMKSLAEVKSVSIRLKNDLDQNRDAAARYEKKAMMLLEKAEKGELDPVEADRLATEALVKRDKGAERAVRLAQDVANQEKLTSQLEGSVQKLKQQISSWENELTTLRARAKVAKATKKFNKQMAQVDSSGTISMLERMKDKVQEDESMAQSYGELAAMETSVDSEIDAALQGGSPVASSSLAELKAKMQAK